VVAEEAVGAAALAGIRLVFQVVGAVLVSRAPLIIAFLASLLGYSLSEPPSDGHDTDVMMSVLHAVRPIFAAAIAVAVGEAVVWAARRLDRGRLPV
jgi:hypothetical protein